MAKRSKAFDLVIGAAVLGIISVVAVPSPNDDQDSGPSPALSFSSLNEEEQAIELLNDQVMVEKPEYAELVDWGRNPFLEPPPPPPPPVVEVEPEPELEPEPIDLGPPTDLPTLKGISSANGQSLAILGRQIVGLGDVLPSGFEVLSIGAQSVDVRRDDRVFTLHMEQK